MISNYLESRSLFLLLLFSIIIYFVCAIILAFIDAPLLLASPLYYRLTSTRMPDPGEYRPALRLMMNTIIFIGGSFGSESWFRLVFNLCHTLIPAFSLLICLLILDQEKCHIMFWVAIGAIATTSVGQFLFQAEGIMLAQLMWIPWIWILFGKKSLAFALLSIATTIFLTGLYPGVVPVLGLSGLFLLLTSKYNPEKQKRRRNFGLFFVICAVTRVFTPLTPYDKVRVGRFFDAQFWYLVKADYFAISAILVVFAVIIGVLGLRSSKDLSRLRSSLYITLATIFSILAILIPALNFQYIPDHYPLTRLLAPLLALLPLFVTAYLFFIQSVPNYLIKNASIAASLIILTASYALMHDGLIAKSRMDELALALASKRPLDCIEVNDFQFNKPYPFNTWSLPYNALTVAKTPDPLLLPPGGCSSVLNSDFKAWRQWQKDFNID